MVILLLMCAFGAFSIYWGLYGEDKHYENKINKYIINSNPISLVQKGIDVINSCKTFDQLMSARKYCKNILEYIEHDFKTIVGDSIFKEHFYGKHIRYYKSIFNQEFDKQYDLIFDKKHKYPANRFSLQL